MVKSVGRLLIVFAITAFSVSVMSQEKRPVRPKVVVSMVIDQMRWEYQALFAQHYTTGGFRTRHKTMERE